MTTNPKEALAAIRSKVEAACERVQRDAGTVTLIGVSKVQPAAKIEALFGAGLTVFGENRVQEAATKIPALDASIDWHLIGPLQSNKVRRALELFSTIHAVDRLKIARAIDRVAAERALNPKIFLEINVGEEESKHGFLESQLAGQLDALRELQQTRVVGLMAIPPYEEDPEAARRWFGKLRRLRDELNDEALPGWEGRLSMGMSSDFEIAIEEGATHVRVGTALFGVRDPASMENPK